MVFVGKVWKNRQEAPEADKKESDTGVFLRAFTIQINIVFQQ